MFQIILKGSGIFTTVFKEHAWKVALRSYNNNVRSIRNKWIKNYSLNQPFNMSLECLLFYAKDSSDKYGYFSTSQPILLKGRVFIKIAKEFTDSL